MTLSEDPNRPGASSPFSSHPLWSDDHQFKRTSDLKLHRLTTAAGMWVASAIGLMFSAGMYMSAIIAALFAYLILDLHKLFPRLFHVSRNDQEEEERHEEDKDK